MMNKRTSQNILVVLLLVCANILFAQEYLLPNEELIYSFETKNGKKLVIAKDKEDGYMIYRFGTKKKLELEFPGKTKESWNQFKYSYYLRGGGVQNEGMDLNYVYFINGDYKYVIYDTYYAPEDKTEIGIKITNLKDNTTTDIKGKTKTQKGNLVNFRMNNLIKTDDELQE